MPAQPSQRTFAIDFGLREKARSAVRDLENLFPEYLRTRAEYERTWAGLVDAVIAGTCDSVFWTDKSGNANCVVRSLRGEGAAMHIFDRYGNACSTFYAADGRDFVSQGLDSDGIVVSVYSTELFQPTTIDAAKRAQAAMPKRMAIKRTVSGPVA